MAAKITRSGADRAHSICLSLHSPMDSFLSIISIIFVFVPVPFIPLKEDIPSPARAATKQPLLGKATRTAVCFVAVHGGSRTPRIRRNKRHVGKNRSPVIMALFREK
uniref:Ribosomal protein L2 n=1 Tax=Knipowitschia caucasica TaxID=637954 RepID=A0AAV2M6Z1_KNICA